MPEPPYAWTSGFHGPDWDTLSYGEGEDSTPLWDALEQLDDHTLVKVWVVNRYWKGGKLHLLFFGTAKNALEWGEAPTMWDDQP